MNPAIHIGARRHKHRNSEPDHGKDCGADYQLNEREAFFILFKL
jgi:hypothetical protein